MARATPHASGLPDFLTVDLRAISLAEGVRAALSTATLVAANEWVRSPLLAGAALAAWLTCLCDAGGPIRRRVPALLAFGVLGAILTGGFGLLRAGPLPLVVAAAALGMFCTSFARVWGQSAMQVGNLLTVALVLALRVQFGTWDEAAAAGGAFLGGSLWALLLTMVIWRVYPYLPARRAVAECYRAVARLVEDLRLVLAHPAAEAAHWERHARAHRRQVRDAIEAARAAVMATVRQRGPSSARAAQSSIRLETADQIFGALIGLSDLLEGERDPAVREAADTILRRLRPVLLLLADYIVTDQPKRLERLERAVAEMAAAAPPGLRLFAPVARILDRVQIAITLAAPSGMLTPGDGAGLVAGWRERVLRPVLTNFEPNSAVLRHALRVAAVSVPAIAITLRWPGPYEYWLTITLVMTMQPFFALTFTRALERIAGTVLGGVFAAGLAMAFTSPLSLALAIFPLAIVAFALRPVSFGLFITGITPIVVLLSELGTPTETEFQIALLRALYTLIGGGLAVVGSIVLWPSWEPSRLRRELRQAVAAHGRFARAEIGAVLGEAPATEVDAARREAGVASNSVEASLQRALLEPHGGADLEPALTVDSALRRMAGRLSALQLDPGRDHDATAWHAWRDYIEATTTALAAGETTLPERPTVPAGDPQAPSLVRIARQLDLIAGALGRVREA